MSDYTSNGGLHPAKRVPRVEFVIYFTMIFCLALGPHLLGWTYQLIRHMALPRLSPVARAWLDAQAVTPMIFRG